MSEDHPAGDAVVGALHPGGGEFLLDQQLLHRPGRAAPGPRPVRHDAAGGDEFVELGLLVEGGDTLGVGPDLGAHLLGLRRQVQAVRPRDPAAVSEDVGSRSVPAEQRLHGQRATQMQVGVVPQVNPMPPCTWMFSSALRT